MTGKRYEHILRQRWRRPYRQSQYIHHDVVLHARQLLFDPKLIPADVRAQLGPDLHVRHCSASNVRQTHPHTDASFSQDRLHVLAFISSLCPHRRVCVVSDPGVEAYSAAFDKLRFSPFTYFTLVIVHKPTDQIVAVGCVFVEQKFVKALRKVSHIEDIAVNKRMQGRKLGLRVIYITRTYGD